MGYLNEHLWSVITTRNSSYQGTFCSKEQYLVRVSRVFKLSEFKKTK